MLIVNGRMDKRMRMSRQAQARLWGVFAALYPLRLLMQMAEPIEPAWGKTLFFKSRRTRKIINI